MLLACGPNIGALEPGETGRVVRAYNGDTLELDSGLRVFLAEIDAPRGDTAYASQSNGELEALALHRNVRLAYGGERRWSPREEDAQPRGETALAHVFVQSEGGRWFWLQQALVSRGAAFVRPSAENHARASELLALEVQARDSERGLWARRDHRPLDASAAAQAARNASVRCFDREAPYRIVEGRVAEGETLADRAWVTLEGGADQTPFALVAFGEDFATWDGPAFAELGGARLRARGRLGMFENEPQLCIEHASQLELLSD